MNLRLRTFIPFPIPVSLGPYLLTSGFFGRLVAKLQPVIHLRGGHLSGLENNDLRSS
jgi:hypothetical protein